MAFINKHDLLKGAMQSDKFQFRIGELATMTGVSTRQLRYWESKDIIEARNRDAEEARVYSYKTYLKVMTIKYFLDEGHTLKSAVSHTDELTAAWRTVHTVANTMFQGVGVLDDQEVVDLGFLDEDKTQRLFAYSEDDQVHYLVRSTDELND